MTPSVRWCVWRAWRKVREWVWNRLVGAALHTGHARAAQLESELIRLVLGSLTNFATCVDARLGAREIFKSGVARGRVLTCVRPLLRRVPCRGPRWESGDQVQVRPTRLKRLSQSWFSRSRLSTVAPSLSFDPSTPDGLAVVATPTSPQPELDKPHRGPAASRRSGPSCWPALPAPAGVACGRACAPALIQPGRPCARPSVPPRWPH